MRLRWCMALALTLALLPSTARASSAAASAATANVTVHKCPAHNAHCQSPGYPGGDVPYSCTLGWDTMSLECTTCKKSGDDGHGGQPLGTKFPFLILMLILGAAVQTVIKKVPSSIQKMLPFSVVMFALGAFLGLLENKGWMHCALIDSVDSWKHVDPHSVIFGLLPPLLFESAFNVNYHVFSKVKKQAVFLATFGVTVSTIITGFICLSLFGDDLKVLSSDCKYNISSPFSSCTKGNCCGADPTWASFLYGTIVSATDPVAVVAVLGQLGAPAKLGHMIEAESLLNDGTAVVLFFVCQKALNHNIGTVVDVAILMLRLVLCGTVFGFVCAEIVYHWLAYCRHVQWLDISILIFTVYIVFYVGEHVLGFSGVLAIVTFGLNLARKKEFVMHHDTLHANHAVWTQISFMANSLIFALAGVIIFRTVEEATDLEFSKQIPLSFVMYFALTFVRLFVVFSSKCLMRYLSNSCIPGLKGMVKPGFEVNNQEAFMMVHSALRGAVSLCVVLFVENDHSLPKAVREVIVFQVCMVVTLTIVINGTTASAVYTNILELATPGKDRGPLDVRTVQNLLKAIEHKLKEHETHWFHGGADYKTLRKLVKPSLFNENGDAKPEAVDDTSVGRIYFEAVDKNWLPPDKLDSKSLAFKEDVSHIWTNHKKHNHIYGFYRAARLKDMNLKATAKNHPQRTQSIGAKLKEAPRILERTDSGCIQLTNLAGARASMTSLVRKAPKCNAVDNAHKDFASTTPSSKMSYHHHHHPHHAPVARHSSDTDSPTTDDDDFDGKIERYSIYIQALHEHYHEMLDEQKLQVHTWHYLDRALNYATDILAKMKEKERERKQGNENESGEESAQPIMESWLNIKETMEAFKLKPEQRATPPFHKLMLALEIVHAVLSAHHKVPMHLNEIQGLVLNNVQGNKDIEIEMQSVVLEAQDYLQHLYDTTGNTVITAHTVLAQRVIVHKLIHHTVSEYAKLGLLGKDAGGFMKFLLQDRVDSTSRHLHLGSHRLLHWVKETLYDYGCRRQTVMAHIEDIIEEEEERDNESRRQRELESRNAATFNLSKNAEQEKQEPDTLGTKSEIKELLQNNW